MTHIGFPHRADATGRTAAATDREYLRILIEHVLFTGPGERVNRPDFGSGLRQLVFAPNAASLEAASHVAVRGSLQAYLGDLVEVQDVEVTAEDASLTIRVAFRERAGGAVDEVTLRRTV